MLKTYLTFKILDEAWLSINAFLGIPVGTPLCIVCTEKMVGLC